MSRVKAVMVAVFAIVAVNAIAVSAASASWFAGGTEVKALTRVSTTAKVDATTTLTLPTQKIKVVCSGALLKGEGVEILQGDKGQASALIFEGCKTTEPATGCGLSQETIKTVAITATATLATAPEDRVLFEPKTGKQFTTIPFKEKNTCALEGEQPIKGKVVIQAPTGQTEEPAQAIEGMGSVENNSLEVGSGNKAFLEGGKALVTLENGSKWSFK